jgi:archaellum component FlaC
MREIPQEYMVASDFGFSAVDETEFKSSQPIQQVIPEVPGFEDNFQRLEQELQRIGTKIDSLVTKISGIDDEFDIVKQKTQEEIAGKVKELEAIIMPLLINLLKTADKDYIHWPNRQQQIQAQIDKVLSITRG